MQQITHHPIFSSISTDSQQKSELNLDDLIVSLASNALSFQIPALSNAFIPFQSPLKQAFGTYNYACQNVNQLLISLNKVDTIARICQQSSIGKKLPTALYVHVSALTQLNPLLRLAEHWGRYALPANYETTLVKFHTNQLLVSYLYYPDFDRDPHPVLYSSIQVNLPKGSIRKNNYSLSDNPPILHRKETFVSSNYPQYQTFLQLTKREEELGLLEYKNDNDQTHSSENERLYRTIGSYKGWQQHLEKNGVEIRGHQVISNCISDQPTPLIPKIERHKAAITRKTLSRPVKLCLEAELFNDKGTFFDYGCGYGSDVKLLAEKEIDTAGWDPFYAPENSLKSADIVNLGYVINVIEDQAERREALLKAWELTKKVLIVSAQILIADRNRGVMAYSDGVITRRNTFQKYYEQEELKTYIDQVLGVDSIPVGLGIYFVFRDESQAESFRASRFRSRVKSPQVRKFVRRFEDYEILLQPLIDFVSDRGRLPVSGELAAEAEIRAEFNTLSRAFKVILQATDSQEWDIIAQKRRQDLLVYLALTQFSRRPRLSQLEPIIQHDIKGLFGSYKAACFLADQLLFSIGDLEKIAQCCQQSEIGQKRSASLWVHISALAQLNPLLRLYEGCANRTIGRLEAATLVKFHTKTPKITYLFYPEFDTDPHPILSTRMEIDLRDLQVTYQAYQGPNSPILHRKEMFVTPDYPLHNKFAKLTHQEQDWGLLDDWKSIQTRQGWLQCLEEHCAELKGHRVYWRTDADPYRVKLLKSARRSRRKSSPLD
ncbi:MAG: DNA phosphorothioation-associated putative methyltransferase [Microcoleaceae cyanobacterium]